MINEENQPGNPETAEDAVLAPVVMISLTLLKIMLIALSKNQKELNKKLKQPL